MKRKALEKRLREVARAKGVAATFEEGANHTIVRFDGYKVTVLGRHVEINENTARGAIREALTWEKPR